MPDPSISYVTGSAVQIARAIGLDLRRDDWRDIVLAITDTMANDDQRSMRVDVLAHFVGPVRDGERWTIEGMGTRRFDVLYSPDRAMVTGIVRPREGSTMMVTPSPKPLVDAV